MKSQLKVTLLLLLVTAVCLQAGGLAIASEEVELPKFAFYIKENVEFDKIPEYREAVKEFNAIMAECKFPFAWETYVEMNQFLYCIRLHSQADLDAIDAEFMKLFKKSGEKMLPVMKRTYECAESSSTALGSLLNEFRYIPENPAHRFDPEKSCYCEVWDFLLYPGTTMDFKGILGEYSSLYKEKKVPINMTCGEITIGENLPRIWVASTAETEEEYKLLSKKVNEMIGEAAVDIRKKSLKFIKEIKVLRLRYDASLSYFPEQ